jgi:hypothetical protein
MSEAKRAKKWVFKWSKENKPRPKPRSIKSQIVNFKDIEQGLLVRLVTEKLEAERRKLL